MALTKTEKKKRNFWVFYGNIETKPLKFKFNNIRKCEEAKREQRDMSTWDMQIAEE